MALIFNRIAKNLAKNGFFPTDAVTLSRILSALGADGVQPRLLDPCCGEGVALQSIADQIEGSTTYGIEFDQERAAAARKRLTHVLWADVQDTVLEPSGFGLLFLNPPYGHLASDRAQTGNESINRFEELFFRLAVPSLQFGGVMVLIIPRYELGGQLATWISKSFTSIKVFVAPEQTYKQIVLFGVRRPAAQQGYETIARYLSAVGAGDVAIEELPDAWSDQVYMIPDPAKLKPDFRFGTVSLDPLQVEDIKRGNPVLWNHFDALFRTREGSQRAPLREVSEWHLALLLAAGAIGGVVRGRQGEALLVKGNTTKATNKAVTHEFNEDGSLRAEITTTTEKFVAEIMAIDINPHSPRFGEAFNIK